jgi:hypothetical protein
MANNVYIIVDGHFGLVEFDELCETLLEDEHG